MVYNFWATDRFHSDTVLVSWNHVTRFSTNNQVFAKFYAVKSIASAPLICRRRLQISTKTNWLIVSIDFPHSPPSVHLNSQVC